MTTVASPSISSSWNAVRFLVVALLIVAAASLAFLVGRVTVGHSTRTVNITRVVPVPASSPDACRIVHTGAC
jgi:hypothetical protein